MKYIIAVCFSFSILISNAKIKADSLILSEDKIRISGTIFQDKNLNGRLDRGDSRIKGVGVTNGDDIVYCDSRGRYSILVEDGGYVIPILPSGFIGSTTAPQNRLIRKVSIDSLKENQRVDFPLIKTKEKESYRFAIIGDPQVKNEQELSYARIFLSEVAEREDLDYSILMGDLVNDNMDLLPKYPDFLKLFSHPTWSIIGNHDVDKDRSKASFLNLIGADNTAFYRGKTCFVLLNNVEGDKKELISPAGLLTSSLIFSWFFICLINR